MFKTFILFKEYKRKRKENAEAGGKNTQKAKGKIIYSFYMLTHIFHYPYFMAQEMMALDQKWKHFLIIVF